MGWSDWIVEHSEDNRDALGRLLQCRNHRRATADNQSGAELTISTE
jgi:hypothetical protein